MKIEPAIAVDTAEFDAWVASLRLLVVRLNLHADWTADAAGRSNSSPAFLAVCDEVERLIRGDAYMLLQGCADRTARLIVAQLAHVHGLTPMRGVGDAT